MADSQLEETLEAGNDALDMRDDVQERRYEWHVLNSRASLVELYVRGNFRVHVHIGIRGRLDEGEVGYWCAVFEALPSVDVHVVEVETPHVAKSESLHGEHGANGLDDSVLIGVVNVVKQPQEVGFRLVPSTVRLKPLDECFLTRGEVLDESTSVVPITIRGGGDGKGCSVVRRRGLQQRQLPNELVESRPQIVHDIPDDDAPVLGRVVKNLGPKDALLGLTVVIRDHSVGVSVDESLNSFLKGFEVHIRPANLESRAIEGVAHKR